MTDIVIAKNLTSATIEVLKWVLEDDHAKDLDYYWEDCTIGFGCLCGNDIQVDSQDGPRTCTCGRVYRLSATLEVDDSGVRGG